MKRFFFVLVVLIFAMGAVTVYAEIPADLLKKAKQGDAQAQHNLATLYEQGLRTTKDYQEAFRWFEKSALQGLWTSQASLSYIYSDGRGVPKNYVMAYAWMSIANASGKMTTGSQQLNNLEKMMTPEKIAEAQRLAAELWEKIPH